MRLRLMDIRLSRFPEILGICQANVPAVAARVNTVERRLLFAREAGEESWWGTWAEMAFTVSRDYPYFTTPRNVDRLEAVAICDRVIPVQNQFYEYLQFGNGHLPKHYRASCRHREMQVLSRNSVFTFHDFVGPAFLAAYSTSNLDENKRVLFQGVDSNGAAVTSLDGANNVQGVYVSLPEAGFVATPIQFNSITGIQKDITYGTVQIFRVDPATADQTLIHTMEPGEQTAQYRRYYFENLPPTCCYSPQYPPAVPIVGNQPLTVTAIAKLAPVPVMADQDYTLLQNLEAFIEEGQSARLSEIDSTDAKSMAAERHIQAIRLLNGELTHHLGKLNPAVGVRPFGSARLPRQRIGTMI